jgi:hypothetical protein
MALLLFLLYRGQYLGWFVSTPVCLAAGAAVVVAAVFIWHELRAPEPFVDMNVFTFRTVTLAMVAAAFFNASLYGVAIMVPRYLLLRGYPEWHAGLVMIPGALVMMTTMILAGIVARRSFKVFAVWIALAGTTASTFWLSRLDLYTPWQWTMAMTCVSGAFSGVSLALLVKLTFEGQTAADVAHTGAMKFFLRLFGGTVGTLGASILLVSSTAVAFEDLRLGMPPGRGPYALVEEAVRAHMIARGSPPPVAAAQAPAVIGGWVSLNAQVIGYQSVLRYLALLSAVALLISVFIGRRPEISILDPNERP